MHKKGHSLILCFKTVKYTKYKFHEETNKWVETEFISMWDFNKLPALQTGEDGLFQQHYLKLQVKENAQSFLQILLQVRYKVVILRIKKKNLILLPSLSQF